MTAPCRTCYGHGLWGVGDAVPIGGMDARESYSTIRCPECGPTVTPHRMIVATQHHG